MHCTFPLNAVKQDLRYVVCSGLVAVSQVIANQQRRVSKLVLLKRQSACAHIRMFNAPPFQFFLKTCCYHMDYGCYVLWGLNVAQVRGYGDAIVCGRGQMALGGASRSVVLQNSTTMQFN